MLKKLLWLLFSFKGRLNREGYLLGGFLAFALLMGSAATPFPFVYIAGVLFLWIFLAVSAKRAHDTKDKTLRDTFVRNGLMYTDTDPAENEHGKPYNTLFPPDDGSSSAQ